MRQWVPRGILRVRTQRGQQRPKHTGRLPAGGAARSKLAACPGLAPGPSMRTLSASSSARASHPPPSHLPSGTHCPAPEGHTGSPPNAPCHLLGPQSSWPAPDTCPDFKGWARHRQAGWGLQESGASRGEVVAAPRPSHPPPRLTSGPHPLTLWRSSLSKRGLQAPSPVPAPPQKSLPPAATRLPASPSMAHPGIPLPQKVRCPHWAPPGQRCHPVPPFLPVLGPHRDPESSKHSKQDSCVNKFLVRKEGRREGRGGEKEGGRRGEEEGMRAPAAGLATPVWPHKDPAATSP